MPRRDDFSTMQMKCVVCSNPIPADRREDAITCSKACTKARSDWKRSQIDHNYCRYCQRPASPEERARYLRWRQWEKAGQSEEKSAAKLLREVERLKKQLAEVTTHDEQ